MSLKDYTHKVTDLKVHGLHNEVKVGDVIIIGDFKILVAGTKGSIVRLVFDVPRDIEIKKIKAGTDDSKAL